MDPFRDGRRQQVLQAMSDDQRRRHLARARLIGTCVLLAATIVGLIGFECAIAADRGNIIFVRSFNVALALGFIVALVLLGLAIYAFRERRRTKQSIWVGVAAILVAILSLAPWAAAVLNSLVWNGFGMAN